ncbi:MAG: pilus assembly protein PilO [Bacillota bacterium]|nr:pilus assembly protein PilO [Bacillota bacterium]
MAYFLYLQPLSTQLDQKRQSLTMEHKLLEVVQSKNSGLRRSTFENTTMLQQKLPVKPLTEQLILDVEKAEIISNSSIKSIALSDESSTQENAGTSTAINNAVNNAGNGNIVPSPDSSTNKTDAGGNLPAGVKKITLNLSVESAGYEDFEKFVETIENSQRIFVVESIDYSGANEITSLDGQITPFTYNLTVSAFYMPGLKDLQKEIPKLETPDPANKQTPLTQFP